MAQVTYQRETFDQCFAEALPLLDRHYREIAHYQDIALNVDVNRYKLAEAAGVLRIFTARAAHLPEFGFDVEQKLVGYAAFFVSRNPHYADSVQAVQDVIYIDQSFRRGRIGLGLIDYCEAQLADEGAQVVMHHVKVAHPALGTILSRKGYEMVDTIYAKRLDLVKG